MTQQEVMQTPKTVRILHGISPMIGRWSYLLLLQQLRPLLLGSIQDDALLRRCAGFCSFPALASSLCLLVQHLLLCTAPCLVSGSGAAKGWVACMGRDVVD